MKHRRARVTGVPSVVSENVLGPNPQIRGVPSYPPRTGASLLAHLPTVFCASRVAGLSGAGQNEGMKRTLLFVLALIAVGCAEPIPDLEEMRALAEQGDAIAQNDLGLMYANGEGVPQDDAEAVRWYRLAAEQGYVNAQTSFGFMYANGRGVPQDDAEAVRWYRLAAEQGYVIAQTNLGVMYSTGQGVPEDIVLAHMWYNLAAAQGRDIALGNKDILEQRMTREQIAEGQRMSTEWLEAHPSSN